MLTFPFVFACIWLVTANVLAMIPSKDNHWQRAYVLIAFGVPVFFWLWWSNGLLLAIIFLFAGMSVLRWPVIYLVRWIKRQFGA